MTATKPVQAHLITGDVNSRYESRWFTLYPTEQWSDSYYSPVGTANDGDKAFVFLFNPATNGTVTVQYDTQAGSGSFTINPGDVYKFEMPKNSGAHFYSDGGEPFFAVEAVGANPSSNLVHDWGFSLVPESNLTTELVIGWGPGNGNDPPTDNGSPVWVTANADTLIYVDYDGDPSNSSNTAPNGEKYDVVLTLNKLQVRTIGAPSHDATGMRIFTADGALITGAWGQDPAVAGAGAPYLDMGTTILPFPVPSIRKSSELLVDADSSGSISIGDTLRYTLKVNNDGVVVLAGLVAIDDLPSNVTYVLGSTTFDGAPLPDATTGTPFPLDETGYVIPVIPPGEFSYFTYDLVVDSGTSVENTVVGSGAGVIIEDTEQNPVEPPAGVTDCALTFASDSSGTAATSFFEGDGIYVRLADGDQNLSDSAQNTVLVTITNTTNGDVESLVLTETTNTSGIFVNTAALPSSATSGQSDLDGTLNLAAGDSLEVDYIDTRFGGTCSAGAVVAIQTDTKTLYLTGAGGGLTDGLDRSDPSGESPVDSSTATSAEVNAGGSSAVSVDATSSKAVENSASTTLAHTTGAGTNRLMLVGISAYTGSATTQVSSVSYAGQNLTFVGRRRDGTSGTGNITLTEVWRLVNPPSGAGTISVSLNASSFGWIVGATTFTGVNQSTPLGTPVLTSGSTGTPTATVNSASGELVFDVIAREWPGSATPGAGQTERWDRSDPDDILGASSTEAGASSVTMSWSTDVNTYPWSQVAVPIKAVTTSATSAVYTQSLAMQDDLVIPAGGQVSVTNYVQTASALVPDAVPGSYAVTAPTSVTGDADGNPASPWGSNGTTPLVLNFNTSGQVPAGATVTSVAVVVSGQTVGQSYRNEIDMRLNVPGGANQTWDFGDDLGQPGSGGSYSNVSVSSTAGAGSTAVGTFSLTFTEDFNDTGTDQNVTSVSVTVNYEVASGTVSRPPPRPLATRARAARPSPP
ncbi:MAG: hypothetical protein R3F19_20740 [Verrucomicrobiales bacterium]